MPAAALPRYLRAASARLPAAARRRRHLRRGGRFRWWWRRGRPDVGTCHPVTARPGATCGRCRRRCRRCRLVPPASHGEPAAARTTANMAARPVRPLPAGRREGGRGETLGEVKPPPPSCERAALRPLADRGSGGSAASSNPPPRVLKAPVPQSRSGAHSDRIPSWIILGIKLKESRIRLDIRKKSSL